MPTPSRQHIFEPTWFNCVVLSSMLFFKNQNSDDMHSDKCITLRRHILSIDLASILIYPFSQFVCGDKNQHQGSVVACAWCNSDSDLAFSFVLSSEPPRLYTHCTFLLPYEWHLHKPP
jgi:hypothetical protein